MVKQQISERKRSNKIMLGSLASSNVFLLNITRDIRDATLLEPILWAYQRLHLAEMKGVNGNKDNKRRLTNIKLILVIRDCQEWMDQAWLNEQKNEIHTRLTQCLKTLNKRHKMNENEEKTNDDFISQIIRGIEYFPMPSAFDTESGANPRFSQRCNQLREMIFNHIERCNREENSGNIFNNAIDWCSNVTQLWDCIVKYEDVLCVADFHTHAAHDTMEAAINQRFDKMRGLIHEEISLSMKKHLMIGGASIDDRCAPFRNELRKTVMKNVQMIKEEITKNKSLQHIMKKHPSIANTYNSELDNKAYLYIVDKEGMFFDEINEMRLIEVENDVTTQLNDLVIKLQQGTTPDKNNQQKDQENDDNKSDETSSGVKM